MVQFLTTEEQHNLHHRYKMDDLYRQWSPILAMLQRDFDEIETVTLWTVAENQITRLRYENSFCEQEIAILFNDLLTECKCLSLKNNKVERTDIQARHSATTIMCVILTKLMNTVEKGHEEEYFDNEPICMAIMDILAQDEYFQRLMKLFFDRKTGYDGKKVIIKAQDPMLQETTLANMDEVAKKEKDVMVKSILSRTQNLQTFFKAHWKQWQQLCELICQDTELLSKLKVISPRNNEWELNQKMICNIVGLYIQKHSIYVSVKAINTALSNKQLCSYIWNHADYSGSDSSLNSEQHQRIEIMISNLIAKG